MPNLNYRAGARAEYGRRKHWQKRGYAVMRSAGSHGEFDLVGIHTENPELPIEFIQVKRTKSRALAKSMIKKFKEDPPFLQSTHYHMTMEVQIAGTSEVLSFTI